MDPKGKKLKNLHYETLTHMVSRDGKLHRVNGGFWLADPTANDFSAGDWSGPTVSTLRELETLGFITLTTPLDDIKALTLARKAVHGAEANITESGIKALSSGVY
jgi:hypothetical protein